MSKEDVNGELEGGAATTLAGVPESLRRAQESMRQKRLAGIPVERLDPVEKAAANPKSLRMAITGKCWECVGAGHDPNSRTTIRECSVRRCPLWPVRPYQESAS